MFQHLVVAVNGSETSLRALDRAIDLAARLGAALEIVSVAEELPRLPYMTKQADVSAEQSAAERYYGQVHAEAVLQAAQHGVPVTTKILTGHEVQALLDYARSRHADALVLGARGHSRVWGVFLGSTADKLVAHAPTSTLVVRPEEPGRSFKNLVVGLDGSPLGERALAVALDLCRVLGATPRAVSVKEGSPTTGPASRHLWSAYLNGVQERAGATAAAAGVRLATASRRGHAAEEIVTYAEDVDADLIVIGATGHERPWSVTAGGTARRIANEARCAVLIVRPPLEVQRVGGGPPSPLL